MQGLTKKVNEYTFIGTIISLEENGLLPYKVLENMATPERGYVTWSIWFQSSNSTFNNGKWDIYKYRVRALQRHPNDGEF